MWKITVDSIKGLRCCIGRPLKMEALWLVSGVQMRKVVRHKNTISSFVEMYRTYTEYQQIFLQAEVEMGINK